MSSATPRSILSWAGSPQETKVVVSQSVFWERPIDGLRRCFIEASEVMACKEVDNIAQWPNGIPSEYIVGSMCPQSFRRPRELHQCM